MRAFAFRGAKVRVTNHNLVVAQDLTRLLFGRQNLNLLYGLPGETITSVPIESLTGDTSGLRPSVRLLSRDGVVYLLNSSRYAHAAEFLVELDKVIGT